MANQEHLDILTQGVEVWNKWRQEQADIQPNLSYADLSGARLHGANLDRAWLWEANLSRADLSGAHLREAILWVAGLRDLDQKEASYTGKANLCEADLSGAYLPGANLREANLSRAKLMKANLSEIYLNEANLSGANLSEASLWWANLSYAILRGADLSGADLRGANLSGTSLSRANLSKAYLGQTTLWGTDLTEAELSDASVGANIFGDVDLSMVKGLETVVHGAPSIIGIDTIIASQGKIPEIFLRKAGVPPSIIEAIPSLIGSLKPIDFYSCFISYSSKDQDFAERLYADLQCKGVRCWFAPQDMKIGDKIRSRIDEAIRLHDKLLLVLSEHSVESEWVEKEVETAFEKERLQNRVVLFPIRLDNAVMSTTQAWAADIRRTRHIGDFRKWKQHDDYQKAFDRLLRDLKT